MRRWHFLRKNESTRAPRYLLFLACRFKKELEYIGVYSYKLEQGYAIFWDRGQDRTEEIEFRSKEFLWGFVEARNHTRSNLVIITTQPEKTLLALDTFRELQSRGYSIKFMVLDHNRCIIRFSKEGGRNITIISVDNYFERLSEQEILRMANLEDKIAEKDKITPEHVSRSLFIVFRDLIDWWLEQDNGTWSWTLSGLAWNLFRHKYMRHQILIHGHEKALKLERDSLFGGRCEAFYIGKAPRGKYYKLDINSAYPNAMLTNLYPVKLVLYLEEPSIKTFLYYLQRKLVIADVEIKIDRPYVPVRTKDGVVFPVGQFRTVLCSPELHLVLEHGEILKVHRLAVYDGAPIFSEYIRNLWDLRRKCIKRGDRIRSLFYKLLMNTLFGKFAQKKRRIARVGETECEKWGSEKIFDMHTREWEEYVYMGREVLRKEEGGETDNSFPAISSFVTSYVRVHLLELIEKAGWENVYYVDTDSLIVNEKGYKRLQDEIRPTELGKLKIEEEGEDLEILGLKKYRFGGKWVIGGASGTLVTLKNGKMAIAYERKMGLRGALRSGVVWLPLSKKSLFIPTKCYRKGRVKRDGRVEPLRFRPPRKFPLASRFRRLLP
mgnify:CR=1 FL=1